MSGGSAPEPEWPLGLARMAQALGRDLQRAARAAGGPERLWRSGRSELGRVLRCAGAELDAAHRTRSEIDPVGDRARLASAGIAHVGMGSADYPASLTPLPDPPFGIFVRGQIAIAQSHRITGALARQASDHLPLVAEVAVLTR